VKRSSHVAVPWAVASGPLRILEMAVPDRDKARDVLMAAVRSSGGRVLRGGIEVLHKGRKATEMRFLCTAAQYAAVTNAWKKHGAKGRDLPVPAGMRRAMADQATREAAVRKAAEAGDAAKPTIEDDAAKAKDSSSAAAAGKRAQRTTRYRVILRLIDLKDVPPAPVETKTQ